MAVKNKIFIPTLISSVDYQPVRTLPHIYFYNGLKECDKYYIQHYPQTGSSFVLTDSVEQFPYFDYYDGLVPTTGSNSLLFFNETPAYGVTPTASLYTQYWDKYVSLLYNPKTRLINASAIIPLADYFEMELNDIVQWRGNYYHLRAINDYNLKDGTCKLQLLGPVIKDAPAPAIDCTFAFSSSFFSGTTTTTTSTTTTTTSTTTTTAAPTTTTTTIISYQVEYLIVAGGGGGGNQSGGGGGAGGLRSGSITVSSPNTYAVTVGAGGALNTNGNDSSVFSVTSTGGGRGGYGITNPVYNGADGGSGGGGAGSVLGSLGGYGTVGQGRNGGTGSFQSGNHSSAGGGGGSQNTGSTATSTKGGNGGSGSLWLNASRYAGGGGGSYSGNSANIEGFGGPGGGGKGAEEGISAGVAGSVNTGGGGGGGFLTTWTGGAGGSGVVIIRYLGAPVGTGGTITQAEGYTYHTFTSSGTFNPITPPATTTTTAGPGTTTTTSAGTTTTTTAAPTTTTTAAGLLVDYLIVAGGGGGGGTAFTDTPGGGGGAGGYRDGITTLAQGSYPIVVGTGGLGSSNNPNTFPENGTNSSFNGITSTGGGYGGGNITGGSQAGANGGSGGGSPRSNLSAGTGISGQGFAGRVGSLVSGVYYGGGGGSALGTPSAYNTSANGKLWYDGVRYSAGGIGARVPGIPLGNGNPGQGGFGTVSVGGAFTAGNGRNGVVAIRYAGSPVASGGTIVTTGGYTYHYFYSDGTFIYPAPATTTTTSTTTTTTTTTAAPTTTTTTSAYYTFTGCGRGMDVAGACSDANNNRTLYSDCSIIGVGCRIYTNNSGTHLSGYFNVFIDGAVWDIGFVDGYILSYSSTQC